jgi:hypothetical protein
MSSNMARPLRLWPPFACLGVAGLVALAAGCWDSNPCNPGQMLVQNSCYDPMPAGTTATGTGGGDGGGTGGSTGSTTTTGSTMGAGGSDGGADGSADGGP